MNNLDVMWVCMGGGVGYIGRWWIGSIVGEYNKGDFKIGKFIINI